MHNRRIVRDNMRVVDALKTAGVVGLLMQEAAAAPVLKGCHAAGVHPSHSSNSDKSATKSADNVEEALEYIKEVTVLFKRSYSSLSQASRDMALEIIESLKTIEPTLIEQQLRGLEGAARMAYDKASDQRKKALKPTLITVAKARSAICDLNHLVSQMTMPVDIYKSNIDREALLELANHGTKVFLSGRFH